MVARFDGGKFTWDAGALHLRLIAQEGNPSKKIRALAAKKSELKFDEVSSSDNGIRAHVKNPAAPAKNRLTRSSIAISLWIDS